MQGERLKGTGTTNRIKEQIQQDVAELKEKGIQPVLGIIRVGDRPDDISYENSAIKKCDQSGIEVKTFHYPQDMPFEDYEKEFLKINADKTIHGILMLRPLPKHMDEERIKDLISPEKDIDCMSSQSLAKVFFGEESGFAPCTAEAVVRLLEQERIPIEGAECAIIGRSMVVGKPLAMMLLKRNATVTICHTRTRDMQEVTKRADILICAAGRARMIDQSYVKPGAVVVDVGINVDEEGNLCGDADTDSVLQHARLATPVPGGIGGITSWLLIEHVVRAAKRQEQMR